MRIDEDLVNLLQDFVKFLESICDVSLSNDAENARKDILQRSKKYLEINNEELLLSSSSGYLNMCAGKGKGLVLANSNDKSITEYIDPENQQPAESSTPTSQGYYECFPEMKKSSSNLSRKEEINSDSLLVEIYNGFSAELTKNKCYKCGPLLQKEERKFIGFNFEHFRSCWVGLVGTHLLVYSSKVEKHPSDIYSIRGYSSRASPNVTPRDPERGKSAFEVFSPGDKTLVFIAQSPSDMEQWVEAICRLGCYKPDLSPIEDSIPSQDVNLKAPTEEEQYQDVGKIDDNKTIRKKKNLKEIKNSSEDKKQTEIFYTVKKLNIEKSEVDNLPILPARTSRRLPSLPHETASSYEPLDNGYDEDDIYYRIEDFKQPTAALNYQNLNKSDSTSVFSSSSEQETYDDVRNSPLKKVIANEEVVCYDDVEQINRTKSLQELEKTAERTSKKKSLFRRIKKDPDSPKKEKKSSKKIKKNKIKGNDIVVEEILQHELPTYDDVSDVKIDGNCKKIDGNCEKINIDCEKIDKIIYDNEQANYICPPAPRPVQVKSEVKNHEEVYDDIGEIKKSEIVESPLTKRGEFLTSHEVEEHYQVPRSSESIDQGQLTATTIEEELYDDIAILTEFRARQRDAESSSSSSSSFEKTGHNVVKVWNRFASGRKFKSSDNNLTDKSFDSKKSNDDKSTPEKNYESEEDNDAFKLNKFQKLINKMEYSLSNKTKQLSIVHKSHNDLGK